MENQESQVNHNSDKRNNRTIIYIILIALLVCANIYLYVKYNQKEKETIVVKEAVNLDSMRIVDLDAKYTAAYNEVQSLKGQNASLDSIITVKEGEIKKMKESLDAARKQKRISDDEYKKQIANLQQLVEDLKVQIGVLEKQKGVLINQKDSLGKELHSQVDENGKLKTENKVFKQKATLGALLKPQNMTAVGVMYKGSKSKEKVTTSAKKAEKIKICFDIDENKAADAGTKTFMLRIVDPQGVTLAVGSQGSGTFDMSDTGEKMQYTTKQDVDYKQAKQNVCIFWTAGTSGFGKGKYTAEVYQDGYKLGSKEFTLK